MPHGGGKAREPNVPRPDNSPQSFAIVTTFRRLSTAGAEPRHFGAATNDLVCLGAFRPLAEPRAQLPVPSAGSLSPVHLQPLGRLRGHERRGATGREPDASGIAGAARHERRTHLHAPLVRDRHPRGGAKLARIDSPEHGTRPAPSGAPALAGGDPRHRQLRKPGPRTQEQSAYNGHVESVCYHPLFVFNPRGDCLAAKLRPGNVHSAEGWEEVLLPIIDRYRRRRQAVVIRADTAFAMPAIYEALERRGVRYAIRLPANDALERCIEDLVTRPRGRPSYAPLVRH